MPTSADRTAVDTSVAVAALDGGHAVHTACRAAVLERRPALAGHAVFETLSVLTRMPGQLAIDSASAVEIVRRVFPDLLWMEAEAADNLVARCGPLGITGGAVYDALVGEVARVHDAVLLTRDRRARRTYDLLGVSYELIGP